MRLSEYIDEDDDYDEEAHILMCLAYDEDEEEDIDEQR